MAVLLFPYPESYFVYFNNHNNDKYESNILDLTKSLILKVNYNMEPTQLILYQRTIYARNLVEVTNARLCSIQSGIFINVAKYVLKIVIHVRALPGVKNICNLHI